MTRIKCGYIARRRRTKMHLFSSRGPFKTYSNYYSTKHKSFFFLAHQDRDKQKRNFHRLWIARINVVIREREVSYSYSKLIYDIYKRMLFLNRKILAQIAISNRNCLYMIFNKIRQETNRKIYTGII